MKPLMENIKMSSWAEKPAQAFRNTEVHRQFSDSQIVILLYQALCSDKLNHLQKLEGGQVFINKLRNRFT